VGFAKHVGHALTFKILMGDTQKIICWSQLRLASDGENNLKLEMEAGAVPERVYIRSKRVKEGEFVLPAIDAFAIPFVPNKESPGEPTAPSSKVHVSEAQTSQDDDDPPPMIDRPDKESSVDSDDKYSQQDYQDLDDESMDDEEASQEDYDLMRWLDYEEEKAYRSPMDSPPLKDMSCVKTVDDDEDLPPQLREARDKFHTDRLKTGNERAGIDLPLEEMIGRTVLMPPTEIGECFKGHIIEQVDKSRADYKEHPKLIMFKCLVNDKYEEIVSYNQIVDFIENEMEVQRDTYAQVGITSTPSRILGLWHKPAYPLGNRGGDMGALRTEGHQDRYI
jgi:hypothetical protein